MGRRITGHVYWRQEEVDDPAGFWLRREGYGTDSSGINAEYVTPPFAGVFSELIRDDTVFETELMGIQGVKKDEL